MYSDQQISWFGKIFYERFGTRFKIQNYNENYVSISLQNYSGNIFVKSNKSSFFNQDEVKFCNQKLNKEEFNAKLNEDLSAPGLDRTLDVLIEKIDEDYYLYYDVFGLILWMLSRYEEMGTANNLDSHQRFSSSLSHAFKHNYLERPIVDEWLDVMKQLIKKTWKSLDIKNNSFSIDLSHDVDFPSNYAFKTKFNLFKSMVGDLIKRRNIKNFLLGPLIFIFSRSSISKIDPANTFDWIMDQSERLGTKSTFNFVAGKTDLDHDPEYSIDDLRIKKLLLNIGQRGHKIGIHPSYKTFNNIYLIKKELQKIIQICNKLGINFSYESRMHFLRWDSYKTPYLLSKAGVKIDSSMGYADRVGFRAGTCFEYPAYDILNDRPLGIRFKPLIAMEVSLISNKYMGLDRKNTLKKCLELKRICKLFGGKFSLLWHNNNLDTQDKKELYLTIINS